MVVRSFFQVASRDVLKEAPDVNQFTKFDPFGKFIEFAELVFDKAG